MYVIAPDKPSDDKNCSVPRKFFCDVLVDRRGRELVPSDRIVDFPGEVSVHSSVKEWGVVPWELMKREHQPIEDASEPEKIVTALA